MKFNFLSKSRMTAGVIMAAVVIAGSAGAIAYAANGFDTIPKDVLISETGTADNTSGNDLVQTPGNVQGTIEYRKSTHIKTADSPWDFEKSFIQETWIDPETLENREDAKILDGNTVTDFHSTYLTKDGNIITIQRDLNGNALSGSLIQSPENAADKNLLHITLSTFASIKDNFPKLNWTNQNWAEEGTVKADDGKDLTKLSRTYKTSDPENVQVDTRLVAFVDEASGFPVREELYLDCGGTMKMIWYDTYEYGYVNNSDGKLFDTAGVDLQQESFDRTEAGTSVNTENVD